MSIDQMFNPKSKQYETRYDWLFSGKKPPKTKSPLQALRILYTAYRQGKEYFEDNEAPYLQEEVEKIQASLTEAETIVKETLLKHETRRRE